MEIWVVDDEPLARARLERLLTPVGHRVSSFADAEAAQAAALTHLPDMVLLDIALPGASGLAFASWLDALPNPPAVIFVTAHPDYALAAYATHPVDYLVKPVSRERLAQALAAASRPRRAQGLSPVGEPIWTFVLGRRQQQVPQSAIRFLVAEAKGVWADTTLGRFQADGSLQAWEVRLGEAFLRLHRRYLVAKRWLSSWVPDPGEGGGVVALWDGTTLPVSRRHLAAVKRHFASL